LNLAPEFIHLDKGLALHTDLGVLHLDFVVDRVNYMRPLPRGKNELIAKAVGLSKDLSDVIDVTAGLGQDAVVLARLGCRVRAIERSPWIYPLLSDAKARAKADWTERLHFIQADSISYLQELRPVDYPQVIYLDPMFPQKVKTALPRKEMLIFRSVVGDDPDFEDLFKVAMKTAKNRVVVKRPIKSPPIAVGVQHSFKGNSVRYDLYLPN
jgi:16S rRNA (guanine1516-N2)-methyltransferase